MGLFDKMYKKEPHETTDNYSSSGLTADEVLEQAKAYKALNPEKAFQYFLDAAKMGNQEAMANVGYCFLYQGQGVPFDVNQSVYWYNRAAENGYAKSMIMCAWFCMAGVAVPQDDNKAIEWLQKAVQTGDEKTAAIASKQLNSFEQTKLSALSILRIAVEMDGIPPKNA